MNPILLHFAQYIGAYLAWCAYCYLEGTREGWYWPEKYDGTVIVPHNEHRVFLAQRIIAGLFAISYLSPGIYEWSSMAVSFMLATPFWHAGRMYQVRNNLNDKIYPKRFWSDPSSTSTAKRNFTCEERVDMKIWSVSILIATIILTIP